MLRKLENYWFVLIYYFEEIYDMCREWSFWHSGLGFYICERFTQHSAGVVWFNPSGSKPDMTCNRCGENLDSWPPKRHCFAELMYSLEYNLIDRWLEKIKYRGK